MNSILNVIKKGELVLSLIGFIVLCKQFKEEMDDEKTKCL